MKKEQIIAILLTLLGFYCQGQNLKPFPIPSWQVPIDSGATARFQEPKATGLLKSILEKRDVHVKLKSTNPENPYCEAEVWIYSLDGLDAMGPYTVHCGETLVVEIDDRPWGVYVDSEANIIVDVWIE
jgi:hypothetical protein